MPVLDAQRGQIPPEVVQLAQTLENELSVLVSAGHQMRACWVEVLDVQVAILGILCACVLCYYLIFYPIMRKG